MTKDEALKLALEALEEIHVCNMTPMAETNWNKAITAIKKALAQPAQEDPCPGCRKGRVCRTPKCGRLKLPADHPFRFEQPERKLTTNLEASIHAGLDKKNDKNPQVDHQGKQPEQEPVATLWQHGETGRTRITMPGDITDCDARWFKAADLYTSPPHRKPLTVDEVWQNDQLMSLNAQMGCSMDLLIEVVEAIEAAHGIKE